MSIKGLIFDMDGLMVDTEKLLTRFWREASAFYGWEMTQEHVLGIRSLAGKYAGPKLQAQISPDFDYAKVRLKRIELMNAFIEENGIEKKAGLDELIAYGREKGLRLAVATATDNLRAKKYLESKGIAYQDCNIEEDEAARVACQQLSGDLMVPVITANDKDYVLGFDKAKIDALLGA